MTDPRNDEDQPRGHDVGEGYPEEGQPGTGIEPRDHAEQGIGEDIDAHEAPETSKDADGDPSQATGNPGAAGG